MGKGTHCSLSVVTNYRNLKKALHWCGQMAQWVEHLSHKHEVLNSDPQTP